MIAGGGKDVDAKVVASAGAGINGEVGRETI